MKTILILIFSFLFAYSVPDVSKEQIDKAKDYTAQHACATHYAVLINMAMPSDEKRWFVVNLDSIKVVYTTYVAHGRGSGVGKYASTFSDTPGSYCTSLGKYKLGESFFGEHGLSYTLDGLDETNKNALSRGIIIHSAWYAADDFIKKYDRCGNSWGCPAISANALKECKQYLQPGTLVWIYR